MKRSAGINETILAYPIPSEDQIEAMVGGVEVSTLRLIRMQSKAEAVADRLRSEINAGTLPPGTMLRQRDIAERYGVSPTPVREALSRLEAEGFVRGALHRGASVVQHEKARLLENYRIRATLEGLATEIAAPKLKVSELDHLEKLNADLSRSKRANPTAIEFNRAFHMTIYQATDSPMLVAMLRNLWRALDGGPRVDRPIQESVAQHAAIVAALRAGDAQGAAELVRHHILTATPLLKAEEHAGS
jgi:DNA-binding GntR family transcriptional regulator